VGDTTNYNQPDKNAILLDTINDIDLDEYTIPRSTRLEMYYCPIPDEHRQTGLEGVPVFEIRYGNDPNDYVRVNSEIAMSQILNPDEKRDEAARSGIWLQHAIIKAVNKDLIDAGTVGRALARAFSAGRVSSKIVGEVLLSTMFLYHDHPLIVTEQEERDEFYASGDNIEEMQYNEMVDEINRRDRAEGYKSPSDRVASGELEPGEEGFEDYIDEMAAKDPGDDEE
jgi:hypothetical protein